MRNKRIKPDGLYIIKVCQYCNAKFYAKRSTAKFCCDSCRGYSHLEKHRSDHPYGYDVNEGKILAPGTIPSLEMPEDKLILTSDLVSVYNELLLNYLTPSELNREKMYIERLEPYSLTNDWTESVMQILSDKYFIEVFRIFPADYKLYVWPWGDNNPKPFK